MRIVVTGREGQVVRSMLERVKARPDIDVIALGRPDIDLARPAAAIGAIVASEPDVVVSAAAYTAVDDAEREPELARAINVTGAGAVAEAARLCGAPIIHLSTDYVFSGESDVPYREDMATGPISVYGRSKLAGERAVVAANDKAVILRTAWVYSPFGRNFVRTMLRLAATRDVISVVDDQVGNPTSALDLSDAILTIADRLCGGDTSYGLYHYGGRGTASWYAFAEHILSVSARLGGPTAKVLPISSQDYVTAAQRPKNSRLETSKIGWDFGVAAKDWRTSSARIVHRLVEQNYSVETA